MTTSVTAADPTSPDDLDALSALFAGYCDHYKTAHTESAIRRFLSARLLARESVAFIARVGDAPAGFAQLYPKFASTTLSRYWILNDLFVHPDHRRTGTAHALMERCERFAQSTGAGVLVLKTHVTNAPARALYESRGWTVADDFLTYKKVFP